MSAFRIDWTLAGLLCISIIDATGNFAWAEVIRIVSPSAQENVEGDGAVQPPNAPVTLQRLYPATDFAGLPASQRWLVAFNHRGDQTQTEAVDWVFPDTEIWISTTDKTSDTLSTVFAENHGPDKTLVFDGALTQTILGTGSPRDFADGMRFQTPFYYDPSQGNLLVERINRGGSLQDPSPTVDVQSMPGFTVLTGDVDAVSGTRVSRLPLTQFEFEAAATPGDYNADGSVDAADYVVWRDNEGAPAGTLPNDIDGGAIGQAQYDTWKSNFGATSAAFSPTSSSGVVPEPATAPLLFILLVATSAHWRVRGGVGPV